MYITVLALIPWKSGPFYLWRIIDVSSINFCWNITQQNKNGPSPDSDVSGTRFHPKMVPIYANEGNFAKIPFLRPIVNVSENIAVKWIFCKKLSQKVCYLRFLRCPRQTHFFMTLTIWLIIYLKMGILNPGFGTKFE